LYVKNDGFLQQAAGIPGEPCANDFVGKAETIKRRGSAIPDLFQDAFKAF
jgi:hypothetical protein